MKQKVHIAIIWIKYRVSKSMLNKFMHTQAYPSIFCAIATSSDNWKKDEKSSEYVVHVLWLLKSIEPTRPEKGRSYGCYLILI